jgi:transposase
MSRNGNDRPGVPDPEVVPVAQRRRFTAEEKLRILEEAGACTEPGEIGALVRRVVGRGAFSAGTTTNTITAVWG